MLFLVCQWARCATTPLCYIMGSVRLGGFAQLHCSSCVRLEAKERAPNWRLTTTGTMGSLWASWAGNYVYVGVKCSRFSCELYFLTSQVADDDLAIMWLVPFIAQAFQPQGNIHHCATSTTKQAHSTDWYSISMQYKLHKSLKFISCKHCSIVGAGLHGDASSRLVHHCL